MGLLVLGARRRCKVVKNLLIHGSRSLCSSEESWNKTSQCRREAEKLTALEEVDRIAAEKEILEKNDKATKLGRSAEGPTDKEMNKTKYRDFTLSKCMFFSSIRERRKSISFHEVKEGWDLNPKSNLCNKITLIRLTRILLAYPIVSLGPIVYLSEYK